MARPNCPKCGSPLVRGEGMGHWRCKSCNHKWRRETGLEGVEGFWERVEKKTPTPPPTPAPTPPPTPPPTPAPTPSKPPEKDYKYCDKCGRRIGKEAKVCPYCGHGGISAKAKAKVKGKALQVGGITFSNIMDGFIFSITTMILFWLSTLYFLPMVQDFIGVKIIPDWLTATFVGSYLIFIFIASTVITFILAVILGSVSGISFKGLYKAELVFIAVEVVALVSVWWLMPIYCGMFPDQCEFITCMVEYQSYEICMYGETTVEVTKEGNLWENVEITQGVTNGVSYPPVKPEGGQKEYDYTFTIKNTNEVGTQYDINVTEVEVWASSKPDFDESKYVITDPEISPIPKYRLKPGDPEVVDVTFGGEGKKQLPPCERYFYFKIKLTTEQRGGGGSNIRLFVEQKDRLLPEISTNPGPLDIYVRPSPLFLEFDKIKDDGFKVFIEFVNKCTKLRDIESGYGIVHKEKGFTLIWSDILPIDIDSCVDASVIETECPIDEEGKVCFKVEPSTEYRTSMCDEESTEDVVSSIKCYFKLTTDTFEGKETGLMSVISNYDYHYEFDEQLGAVCKGLDGSLVAEEKCYDTDLLGNKKEKDMSIPGADIGRQECCEAMGYDWCRCDPDETDDDICDIEDDGCLDNCS